MTSWFFCGVAACVLFVIAERELILWGDFSDHMCLLISLIILLLLGPLSLAIVWSATTINLLARCLRNHDR